MTKSLVCIQDSSGTFSLKDDELEFLEALVKDFDFDNEEDICDFSELDAFEIKKEIIADHIKSLVHHIGKTHSELCQELGWKKSRFSKVISGKANLTLKTIFEISVATGYDFDLVFNNKNKRACSQPWNKYDSEVEVFYEELPKHSSLPVVDFIDPYRLNAYMDNVNIAEVECLLAVRKQSNKLKDVYEDIKSIGNSFYSIPLAENRHIDDDYFSYKIPGKCVVDG
jgi:antitoxin component HigA of HigAB toxin-antitoxin module